MQLPITQLTDHLWMIDNGLLNMAGMGATYVLRGDSVALIETGSSLNAPAILAGLETLGIHAAEVEQILLTHVHLDHAGGAGVLVQSLPNATVYIHSLTAPYLVEPARLLASVQRAVGELWSIYGTAIPIAAERIKPAEHLRLELGNNVIIEGLPTPGHSPDHLMYWDAGSGTLWTGDGVGMILPTQQFRLPLSPPPAVDVLAQMATFERVRSLPVEQLLISHFGRAPGRPAEILDQMHQQFSELSETVAQSVQAGNLPVEELLERLAPESSSSDPATVRVLRGMAAMSINGMQLYYQRQAKRLES